MAKPDGETMAVEVLTYLAEDPERLGRFLSLTGFDPASLRSASRQPDFARAVLSYLAEDESLLVAFAAHAGVAPDIVGEVARATARPDEGGW